MRHLVNHIYSEVMFCTTRLSFYRSLCTHTSNKHITHTHIKNTHQTHTPHTHITHHTSNTHTSHTYAHCLCQHTHSDSLQGLLFSQHDLMFRIILFSSGLKNGLLQIPNFPEKEKNNNNNRDLETLLDCSHMFPLGDPSPKYKG